VNANVVDSNQKKETSDLYIHADGDILVFEIEAYSVAGVCVEFNLTGENI